MRNILRTSIFLIIFAVGASTAVLAAGPALSIASAGGASVAVSGQGFRRWERVSIRVDAYNPALDSSAPILKWEVYANGKGVFTTSFDNTDKSGASRLTVVATGEKSGEVADIVMIPAASSVTLDQCGNGSFASPQSCTGANWQNGNVGQASGHYYEGDSIPYRFVFSGLTTGAGNPHELIVEWDTTQSGKHAIDYLTTYDRTESTGNNPCSGVTPACGAVMTFPIPIDPNVTAAGVTQIPGQVLTMWGGTITSVSAYTLSAPYTGSSSTRISIFFTATQANPVLAWSGHIGDRVDWADKGGNAANITGSPYHTRFIDLDGSGGNQDRSLSNVAIRLLSKITFVQQATPESSTPVSYSTGNLGGATFSLVDDGNDTDATPNSTSYYLPLGSGASGTYTATQGAASGYNLTSLNCVTGTGGTSTSSTNTVSKSASVTLQYSDTVTCTFTLAAPSAAEVTAAGFVGDAGGRALPGVSVQLMNVFTGETYLARTNNFGRFTFEGLSAGDTFVATVASAKHTFAQPTRTFTLTDSIADLDFTAEP